jgi:hypothetical protein
VRRHERDALLQHPSTCNAIVRRGNAVASARLSKPRTASNNASQLRFRREPDDSDLDDPFSDVRRLGGPRGSWNTTGFASSIPVSNPPSPGPPVSDYSQTIPVVPPSPSSPSIYSTFPTSGHGTPVVPHQSLDGASGFSQSWLFDRASFSTNGGEKGEQNVP